MLANDFAGVRGCRRLAQAAQLAHGHAASPFEARAGFLLGWAPEFGGEGLGGFTHNEPVELSVPAQRLAHRTRCYCDLFWRGEKSRRPLDLECRSRQHHNTGHTYVRDSDRSTALQLDGVDVVEITYAQIADEQSFDALSSLVAQKLGRALPGRTSSFLKRRQEMRGTVLGNWVALAD